MPPEETPAPEVPAASASSSGEPMQPSPELPSPATESPAPATEPATPPTEASPVPVESEPVPNEPVPPAETLPAQIPPNEPIAPEPEPIAPAPAPVVTQPEPQPPASIPVILAPVHVVRDLLAKARVSIQDRKRKKRDKIMEAFTKKNQITNDEVEKLLHVSDATATRYLSALEKEGKIIQVGKQGKNVLYIRTP